MKQPIKLIRGKLKILQESPAGSFLNRLYHRFQASHLPLLTAALAYYAAFSLGPLLLLLAGWISVVLTRRPELAMQYQLALADLVAQITPPQSNSEELVRQSFEVIFSQFSEGAFLRSAISFLVLIWASSNFFASLQYALEIIFNVSQARSFWRKRLVALFLVMMVALVISVEVIGGLFISALRQLGDLIISGLARLSIALPVPNFAWEQALWTELLRIVITTLTFTLCFRYLPKTSSTWVGALFGALFSTLSIILMQRILPIFFQFERFNLIYGVVTSLLLVLLWLYLTLLLFLLGALLVAEVSVQQNALKMTKVKSKG